MAGLQQLLIAYYGDDFTGSTDALEFLARAGIKTVLFMEPPTAEKLAQHPGIRAVGVAGMTRALAAEALEDTVGPALNALKTLGAPHVHYKVCSTFDSSPQTGSIGRVIDIAAEIFQAPLVPLLVGAPALGRHCVFGNLFARLGGDGEIFRLDRHPSMSRHPVTPADESDLRRHLGRQTRKSIGLFDILQIELPFAKARATLDELIAKGAEVVLFDVLHARQLERIGALLDSFASHEHPLFSVGSSGIEMALGAHWRTLGKSGEPVSFAIPGPTEPLLVASGSCSPVTKNQIAWAVGHGFAEMAFLDELARGSTLDEVVDRAVAHLTEGRSLVLFTSTHPVSGTSAEEINAIGGMLGSVVRKILERIRIKRLCVAGGDTSGHVARALGIEALEMIGPLAPGAPLCRAHAGGSPADGMEVVFKGGQVGREDFFGAVLKGQGLLHDCKVSS